MTNELAIEGRRLSREMAYILQQGNLADEIPLKLHSRDTDAGGAPEIHPQMLRWIGAVCTCGRAAICATDCHWGRDKVLGHLDACEPACVPSTRFYASRHKNSPSRLKRALRVVQRLNPHAYDLCFLVIARGYTFEQAAAKINDDNASRGKPEQSPAEFAVLWVSSSSMLSAVY